MPTELSWLLRIWSSGWKERVSQKWSQKLTTFINPNFTTKSKCWKVSQNQMSHSRLQMQRHN